MQCPGPVRGKYDADFRNEDVYCEVAFGLMLTPYGIGFTLPGIKQ